MQQRTVKRDPKAKRVPTTNTSTDTRGFRAAAILLFCIVIAAITVVPYRTAFPQDISRTVEFEDLGFTNPLDVGARPAGMAGAYVAIGNDIHSLIYNPAGLAGIRKVELSFGLQQERSKARNVFYENPTSIDTRDGGIDGFGLAWPLAAYRGSCVGAVGVYRVFSGVFDLDYSGLNEETQTFDNFLLQQTGSVYSYNAGIGVDLSSSLSGGLSFFVLDGSMNNLRQYDFTYVDWTPPRSVFVKEDVSSNLYGFGGRIGVQFFMHKLLSGGVAFTAPTWIKLKGRGIKEITVYVENATDSFEEIDVDFTDEYLLPFRFDVGAAFSRRPVVLTAQLCYSDWTEAAINRKRFRDGETLEATFRETLDYRFGAEVTLPWWPVRARAGYAYLPYPLAYLQADRIEDNESGMTKATVDTEQRRLTCGLGVLISNMLTLDASLSQTYGKRSIDTLIDERKSYRFVLTAAYRF